MMQRKGDSPGRETIALDAHTCWRHGQTIRYRQRFELTKNITVVIAAIVDKVCYYIVLVRVNSSVG